MALLLGLCWAFTSPCLPNLAVMGHQLNSNGPPAWLGSTMIANPTDVGLPALSFPTLALKAEFHL